MNISKYITKKNVVIGVVAGTAIIGGIVAIIINHNMKKRIAEFKDFLDEDDFEYEEFEDDYWDEGDN